jgi:site-specific recombinase
MLSILEQITAADSHADSAPLIALVDTLRPKKNSPDDYASQQVLQLTQLLQQYPAHAAALRSYLITLLSTRRQTSLYTDVGIVSNDGFFTELYSRLMHRLLPPALDERYLPDTIELVLPNNDDYIWIHSVPATYWQQLFLTLKGANHAPEVEDQHTRKTLTELLQAIQIISYRISAIGIEPELIRIYSDIKAFESPFLVQNTELHRYLDSYMAHLNAPDTPREDAKQVLVILEQCEEVVTKIRKSILRLGTSVSLTYRIVRLQQLIKRMRALLSLIDQHAPQSTNNTETTEQENTAIQLGLELVKAKNRQFKVRELLKNNINLLARTVTENASRTGEHYIAETRSEYSSMYRSAAGAGLIIGFMAMIKIALSQLHAAPLIEAFLFSMNYSLGFVLIHILHFTVATKQPAMTASRIAAGLHKTDSKSIDYESLTDMIVKVLRTQFVAVLGNLTIAFPAAYLLAMGYFQMTGHHYVSPEKAMHMLTDINPFSTLTLFYAAIAGVCLFLAGLISGYYDNKALYTRMSKRVCRARWITAVIGKQRAERLGDYLEVGLGGLMGNFYFGILLGTMGTIGFMLGLPLDIRHITFAAANFAISFVGLDGNLSGHLIAVSIAGVLGIGIVNLLVSFSLALFVALRSRQIQVVHRSIILKGLWKRLKQRPLDFFIPPKQTPQAEDSAS